MSHREETLRKTLDTLACLLVGMGPTGREPGSPEVGREKGGEEEKENEGEELLLPSSHTIKMLCGCVVHSCHQ